MSFTKFYDELETSIQKAYETGVSMEEAERLAAKFLKGQLLVSKQLKVDGLDSKMRKSGLKAVRSAVRLSESTKADKKPTEATLDALVDTNDIVQAEQEALNRAETSREELERLYGVFHEAHIYFRGIGKGKFE